MDAHVGKALFENAIMGLVNSGKTVLLVTHALHFVHQADYVYTIVNGYISEQGTYDELIQREGAFFKLMKEFGGENSGEDLDPEAKEILDVDTVAQEKRDLEVEGEGKGQYKASQAIGQAAGTGKIEGRLMRTEKRSIGSLSNRGRPLSCVVLQMY